MATSTTPTPCPTCAAPATGRYCSNCGASLLARSCGHCQADLSPRAGFCHRCGHPVAEDVPPKGRTSDRGAWLFALAMCLLLVGAIIFQVVSDRPAPVAPDMANAGAAVPRDPGEPVTAPGPAPDISRMTPRERFDRLFNRVMQAAGQGDSAQIQRFIPMALGAYAQLDTVNVDARYHAAVLRMQIGDAAAAAGLADTIQVESPGHLFSYLIRGTIAQLGHDRAGLARARRGFLQHYDAEMKAKRVEYLEHQPVLEEFRREAGAR
ncbi:MAG: zinc ribbon domain-containing protein [Gemmatimonadales bacterium]